MQTANTTHQAKLFDRWTDVKLMYAKLKSKSTRTLEILRKVTMGEKVAVETILGVVETILVVVEVKMVVVEKYE